MLLDTDSETAFCFNSIDKREPISFGKFFNYTDKIDMVGFNYHIKKKKFGISLHFTSYKHNMFSFYMVYRYILLPHNLFEKSI